MYSAKDINPINIEEHFKKRPEMYFGAKGPNEQRLTTIAAETARLLTSESPSIQKTNGYCCICSKIDWLNIENDYGINEDNVFDRMWPFPEGGINSARLEALIKVYSSVLISARRDKLTIHKGSLSLAEKEQFMALAGHWGRVLCFRFHNDS